MLRKLTIGIVLCADCLAISLKPQGAAAARNDELGIRIGANASSFQLGPRIIIMQDCSGSTFVQHTAIELLRQHGVQVYFPPSYEPLKPKKNDVYMKEPQKGMGHAMSKLANMAEEQNAAMVFKAEPNRLTGEIVSAMNAHHAHVVHVLRRNVLDQAICKIRDCFSDHFGYPVDASGQPSNSCFQRRFDDTIVEKAHLKVPESMEWMQQTMQTQRGLPTKIVQWGFPPSQTVEEEELAAFQYGATIYNSCDFACSVRAWCRLLLSWDIEANPDIVKNYLASYVSAGVGVKGPPVSHRDTVENYDEIKAALWLAGPTFVGLLRE